MAKLQCQSTERQGFMQRMQDKLTPLKRDKPAFAQPVMPRYELRLAPHHALHVTSIIKFAVANLPVPGSKNSAL